MIKAENLSKLFRVHKRAPGLKSSLISLFKREYTESWALDKASFEVHPGEMVGLVGANGAGKTTLMKMLSGIIHPTAGDAHVLGFRPWERKIEFKKQIALIMGQKAQLWWDLPAADCFLLLQEIYQIPDDVFKKNLAELVDSLQVEKQLHIQIRRLSLGERMKMELIAALLHSPKVVFLDEPTIGLDFNAQKNIREFLLEYRRRHQPAMIITSHYMEDIERLCERLIILSHGRMVYDGAMADVLTQYAPEKMVKAHLKENNAQKPPTLSTLTAEIVSFSKESIHVKVGRKNVPALCQELLAQFSVSDLVIEEEDIGLIITRLMKGHL